MRPIAPDTRAAFTARAASLCTCLRLTRRDGQTLGVTDHDADIAFGGTEFRAGVGAELSALEAGADLAVDNAEIVGILSAGVVDPADIDAGRLDGAEVQVWRVDWSDPDHRILLRTGTLGNVQRRGQGYTAEFRSLKHRLGQVTGRIYGRTCDAGFGDARCGADLTRWRTGAALIAARGDVLAVRMDRELSAPLAGGVLAVTDGSLKGLVRTVREATVAGDEATLSLWDPFPKAPPIGTALTLTTGCDKRFETCRAVFGNVLNFQGFPHMPGNDVLLAPAARRDGGGA